MFIARILIVSAALVTAGTALAQTDRARSEDACGRDASRFCKKVINDGDQAILACLKEHRTRLRAACVKNLQEHGQL